MMLCIVGWMVATVVVLRLGQRGAGWVSAGLYVGVIGAGLLDRGLLAWPGEWATWVAFGWLACVAYFGALIALRRAVIAAVRQALRWSRSLAMWALMAVKRSGEERIVSGV